MVPALVTPIMAHRAHRAHRLQIGRIGRIGAHPAWRRRTPQQASRTAQGVYQLQAEPIRKGKGGS